MLFVLAAVALILVPGPDMLYMLGRCVAQGRRAGILSAIGFNLGGYCTSRLPCSSSRRSWRHPPRRSPS
jgi:threonine/homoserine/homoserine lactone efflux protein